MKENQQKNGWLDEIRDEMHDFEAPIPADGWERISSSLPQVAKPTVGNRWMGIAASVLVCAIVGAGYYFFDNKVGGSIDEPVIAHDNLEEEPLTIITEEPPTQIAAIPQISNGQDTKSAIVKKQKPQETISPLKKEVETEILLANDETPPEYETTPVRKDTVISLPKQEEEQVLLAMSETRHMTNEQAGWSFGLHIGGHGSLLNNEMSIGPESMGDPTIGGSYGENSPEVMDEVVESDNHTSWSFGLSVDHQILPRTTLETGLVYTLLTSDVKMCYSGIKAQNIQYLGIPLKLNYHIVGNDQCQLYASGGLMLEHSLSARRGGERIDVKPWQWSTNLSIGGQFRISSHLALYLEPGISWYYNADNSAPSLRSESPVYFNLRGGVRLR